MGFTDNPTGTITSINNVTEEDKTLLTQTIPFNDSNFESKSKIVSDINNNGANLNYINRMFGLNPTKYNEDAKTVLRTTNSNFNLLTRGYICADKGWIPDLQKDTCTETQSLPSSQSTILSPTAAIPTKPGPPAYQEVAQDNYPSPVSTVGNRESFLGLGDWLKTYSNYNITMPFIEGLSGFDEDVALPGSNAMDTEKILLNDLIDFNKKYQRYLHCNDQKLQGNQTCTANELSTCQNSNDCLSKQIKDYVGRPGQIGKLQTDINNVRGYLNTARLSQADYDKKYYQILQQQKQVVELRNELDMKLMALHNPEKSVYADYKKNFDSTIYSGILMSALATSIVYYVFTEL